MVTEQLTLFQKYFEWKNLNWIVPDGIEFRKTTRKSLGNKYKEMIQVNKGKKILGFFYISNLKNNQYSNTLCWSYADCVGEHSSPTNNPVELVNDWITNLVQ